MTIESEFADLMNQEITIAAPTTRTFRGEASHAAATPYQARVVHRSRMIRTDGGDTISSKSQAYVFGAPGTTVDHLVTLDDGTTPPVIMVERYPDEDGMHHEVIWFGDTAR